MAESTKDWGDLADLFGPGAYEPQLAPHDGPTTQPLDAVWIVIDGSTNVAELIYWHDDRGPGGASVGMRTVKGREYHYWNVPRDVYRAVLAQAIQDADGPSHGASVWELLRRRGYTYKRIA